MRLGAKFLAKIRLLHPSRDLRDARRRVIAPTSWKPRGARQVGSIPNQRKRPGQIDRQNSAPAGQVAHAELPPLARAVE